MSEPSPKYRLTDTFRYEDMANGLDYIVSDDDLDALRARGDAAIKSLNRQASRRPWWRFWMRVEKQTEKAG